MVSKPESPKSFENKVLLLHVAFLSSYFSLLQKQCLGHAMCLISAKSRLHRRDLQTQRVIFGFSTIKEVWNVCKYHLAPFPIKSTRFHANLRHDRDHGSPDPVTKHIILNTSSI
jgi:hypothetical protein